MRFDVAENSVGSIPSAISTISMPDSHVLPSLEAQAASTLDAAIGCQDENDAADQRQEIEESLKERSDPEFRELEPAQRVVPAGRRAFDRPLRAESRSWILFWTYVRYYMQQLDGRDRPPVRVRLPRAHEVFLNLESRSDRP